MKNNARYDMKIFFDFKQLVPASINTFLKDILESGQNSILRK